MGCVLAFLSNYASFLFVRIDTSQSRTVRTNGEKQNLKTKPKTNEQTS